MSEYFLKKYRPIADALLAEHGLTVPDTTRDMLANIITKCRELPKPEPRPPGSRSAWPALQKARTHARQLIKYADHPPTRKTSVPLRCVRVAEAIRSNEDLAGFNLVCAGMDPDALLVALDKHDVSKETLQRLVHIVDEIENAADGIGRPWEPLTYIVRGGCIVWERAGRPIEFRWNSSGGEQGILTGALPDFQRDLVACCDGTHPLVKEKLRAVPVGYGILSAPFYGPRMAKRLNITLPMPKGNLLRGTARDRVLHDAICAWQAWREAHPAKNGTFFS